VSILIIGAGEMGYHLARRLSYEKQDVVIIDQSPDRVNFVSENLDVQALLGRGSSPVALEEARINSAQMLVAVTDSDEVNLVACMMAGLMNPFMKKIARLRRLEDYERSDIAAGKSFGIDLVISPEREAVAKLLQVLQVPAATDVVDFAEGRIKLFGFHLTVDSPLLGRSLMSLRSEFSSKRFLIPAIFRGSEIIIPGGKDILNPYDIVYLLAATETIPELMKMFGLKSTPPKSFMILGATTVGIQTALSLERQGAGRIRLIESDPVKCEEAAGLLDHTLVLKSDNVDEDFLRSEGIEETSVFLAMTEDDNHNALTALLAKRMGVHRVGALTNKVEYQRMLSAIGVDIVVNPRLAGASRILQFIRKGKVVSVSMLPGEVVEAIEFEAMETSQLVDRPLRKIRFPSGAILGAVQRGSEFLIPDGDTIIHPGDRVVVFTRREAIPKIEKLVTVGLEYF
jgi:trk system potassium uptake protein